MPHGNSAPVTAPNWTAIEHELGAYDFVLPEQWYYNLKRHEHLTPEKRLWFAVIVDAMHDLRTCFGSQIQTRKKRYWQAFNWLTGADNGNVRWVCEVLDLNFEAVREAIIKKANGHEDISLRHIWAENSQDVQIGTKTPWRSRGAHQFASFEILGRNVGIETIRKSSISPPDSRDINRASEKAKRLSSTLVEF